MVNDASHVLNSSRMILCWFWHFTGGQQPPVLKETPSLKHQQVRPLKLSQKSDDQWRPPPNLWSCAAALTERGIKPSRDGNSGSTPSVRTGYVSRKAGVWKPKAWSDDLALEPTIKASKSHRRARDVIQKKSNTEMKDFRIHVGVWHNCNIGDNVVRKLVSECGMVVHYWDLSRFDQHSDVES